MKNYFKTILVCCVVGALSLTGSKTYSQNVSSNTIFVLPNTTISVNDNAGVALDFSRLTPRTHAFIEMYDQKGVAFKFKVERKENLKIEVSADTSTLGGVKPNTTVNFIGKGKLYRSINLSELSNQRCGLWCVIAHICCVHVHIGPPGNTWEWSCSNCQGGIE